jgi:hypothetical protein
VSIPAFCDGDGERLDEMARCLLVAHQREQKAIHDLAHYKAEMEQRLTDAAAELAVTSLADAFEPRGCYVYLLWGKSDRKPVYVGMSENVHARIGQHMLDLTKRPHVERVTLIRCESRGAMVLTEARLIAHYQPMLNVLGIRKTA